MNDLHCHLPFALSDGPATREDSEAMLRQAAESGVSYINATVHFGDCRSELEDTVEALRPAANALGITLHPGFEYNFSDLENQTDYLTIGPESSYILVDFNTVTVPYSARMRFFELAKKGIQIIAVHPEVLFESGACHDLRKLRDMDVVFQLNATSFTAETPKNIRRNAERLMQAGLVQLISSDAHRPTGSRRLALTEARQTITAHYGAEIARLLFEVNPERLLKNQDPLEVPRPARSWWKKFF